MEMRDSKVCDTRKKIRTVILRDVGLDSNQRCFKEETLSHSGNCLEYDNVRNRG